MISKIYSVYDEKTEIFNKVMLLSGDKEAIRLFNDLKVDEKKLILANTLMILKCIVLVNLMII